MKITVCLDRGSRVEIYKGTNIFGGYILEVFDRYGKSQRETLSHFQLVNLHMELDKLLEGES